MHERYTRVNESLREKKFGDHSNNYQKYNKDYLTSVNRLQDIGRGCKLKSNRKPPDSFQHKRGPNLCVRRTCIPTARNHGLIATGAICNSPLANPSALLYIRLGSYIGFSNPGPSGYKEVKWWVGRLLLVERSVSTLPERRPAAAGCAGPGCFEAFAQLPELIGGVDFARRVALIANDEVGFGRIAGHGDGVTFGRV